MKVTDFNLDEVRLYLKKHIPNLQVPEHQLLDLLTHVHKYHVHKLDELIFDYTGIKASEAGEKLRNVLKQKFPKEFLKFSSAPPPPPPPPARKIVYGDYEEGFTAPQLYQTLFLIALFSIGVMFYGITGIYAAPIIFFAFLLGFFKKGIYKLIWRKKPLDLVALLQNQVRFSEHHIQHTDDEIYELIRITKIMIGASLRPYTNAHPQVMDLCFKSVRLSDADLISLNDAATQVFMMNLRKSIWDTSSTL